MKPEEHMQAQSNNLQTSGPPRELVREQDKIMLVLSYLGILALIPLLTVNDSEYVKWHAKNGLVLSVAGPIALAIVWRILAAIPIITMLSCLLGPLSSLGLLVVIVLAIVKALNGERWRIPFVSDLAEKF